MDELIDYAKSFIGVPYRWGAHHPHVGFDCSGFTCCVLKAFGLISELHIPAQELFHVLTHTERMSYKLDRGAVCFYGVDDDHITHVNIALNKRFAIEAGGGDHTTLTLERAIEQSAFVRIRPIRKDFLTAIMLPLPV